VHYNGGAVATIAVIRTADVAVRLRAPQNAANNNNNSSSKDSSKKDNSSNIGNSTSSSGSSTDTSKHKINKKNKTKNKALESSSTHSSTLSHNSSASGSCSSLATIGGVQLAEMPPWRTAPFPFPLPASLSTSTKATSDATGNHTNPVGAAAHLNSESSSGSNDGNGNEGAEYNGKSEIKSLSVKDDRIEGEGLESTVAVSHKRSRKNDDEVGAVDTSTTVAANATTPTNPPPLGKLHTSAYRAAPPKGASGDAFTWWICDRARNFIEVSHLEVAFLRVVVSLIFLISAKIGGMLLLFFTLPPNLGCVKCVFILRVSYFTPLFLLLLRAYHLPSLGWPRSLCKTSRHATIQPSHEENCCQQQWSKQQQ